MRIAPSSVRQVSGSIALIPANRNLGWRPGKLQKRADAEARQAADTQAARIPWPQLLKARRLYVKWQSFLLWVRAVEDSEGDFPEWLADAVNKRCAGFPRFLRQQSANDRRSDSPAWCRLEQWINECIFTRPRHEGWMDAVGYYAVRDLIALRDEAFWYYCARQWARSKPARYPSFQEWRKASERCPDDVLDHFETTDDLRELIKLSRRVGARTLGKSVEKYVEWQVFAYWARAAVHRHSRLLDSVKRELRRRCPSFLETAASSTVSEASVREDRFNGLLRWIEEHEFARTSEEGWLPVLVYQARLHPRYARVIDYWRHWQRLRSRHPRSPYPSFEQWSAAADAYTFTREARLPA